MNNLVRLKHAENMNINYDDINFMDYFNPNSKIVLLGCSLNDNNMIFVLRSIKNDKYIILILSKFGSEYLFDSNLCIDSSEDNFFVVDEVFKNTNDINLKENTGLKYEYIVRDFYDIFVTTFMENCNIKFIDYNVVNSSLVDFIKFLSSNKWKYIRNDIQCIITGIISNFCEYNCLVYGYNKFSNEVIIYGSIKNNKVFTVTLTRELMLLINERSFDNSEESFYYHKSNIPTNIGVVASFLKIDVLIDFDLNIPQFNEFDKESFINISEFDKKEILNPDEELAWPIIKGMILAEL